MSLYVDESYNEDLPELEVNLEVPTNDPKIYAVPGTDSESELEQNQPTSITLTRRDRTDNTFLSTDLISFEVIIQSSGDNNAFNDSIEWIVHGQSENSGEGNPHQASNTKTFSFTPNPINRPVDGSRTPNVPIRYRVEVRVSNMRQTFDLEQDEIDIIRQEYVDFGSNDPPGRELVVPPTNPGFNGGNYNLIVDRGMQSVLDNTINNFNQINSEQIQVTITVSSGYRNPRRNLAAGSTIGLNSRHVRGSALDLVITPANPNTWELLRQAGANSGTSICENGPNQVPCNDPSVDHVHIQW